MASAWRPTVLVVDDEPEVADTYALRLRDEYDVDVAYGGEAALEAADGLVDVVLLDRRMPDYSGDEVLRELRNRGLGCRVVMVTAVEPDFDILDMRFDDYLCKPIEQDDLTEAIDHQLKATEYEDHLHELLGITAKLGVLASEKSVSELEDHAEYTELKARARELRDELSGVLEEYADLSFAYGELQDTADELQTAAEEFDEDSLL